LHATTQLPDHFITPRLAAFKSTREYSTWNPSRIDRTSKAASPCVGPRAGTKPQDETLDSSPEIRDALKAVVAVHFDCPNAVTVAPEMYNARWRKK
jgi:hypothetical protein